ncbi:uncharacterized protein LOC103502558 isoform X1 [Cucumis melo]|uniref:Uncharacterized protein LOC103502558 isoform X1 n=1 Tax=Cucumis melo TaxID=3656 RepID=A0ABM3L8Y9_CUCME|nr:uncharacterized protein LOC103502558 isoform X1 [Cucumis melo]XP_050946493.1 uncharacterized protein LOC103502558 isoform X1 [Cucumis melo]
MVFFRPSLTGILRLQGHDWEKPSLFKLDSNRPCGFSRANKGNPRISAKFIAPCYHINKLKKIKSSKDNSILIEDNEEEDIRNEEHWITNQYKQFILRMMKKNYKGRQNNRQTLHAVPENFSSESDENNVPITRRKLFETVFKGKGKETTAENVSKSDKKEAVEK